MGLVEELKRRKGQRGQIEFARELGISQGLLSEILSGHRKVSARVGQRIVRRYPDLEYTVAGYLVGKEEPAAIAS